MTARALACPWCGNTATGPNLSPRCELCHVAARQAEAAAESRNRVVALDDAGYFPPSRQAGAQ